MIRTRKENYNIFYAFVQCGGNAEAAVQKYSEQYPDQRPPSAHNLRRLVSRILTTGSISPTRIEKGRSWVHEVLEAFNEEGTVSVSDVSKRFGISRSIIERILRKHNVLEYEYPHVKREHFPRRIEYSTWLLRKIARNRSFCKYILWSDNAVFTNKGCFNHHNLYMWTDGNLSGVRPRASQNRWSINVWVGICGSYIIGPYLLPDELDGEKYEIFLRRILPTLLEDVPLNIRKNMFFHHDGAPFHYATNVEMYLNQAFPNKWIGQHGFIVWPRWSLDINPLHFFFWKYLKIEVYKKAITSPEELISRLHGAVANINCVMLRNIQRSVEKRAKACIATEGAFVEHLLAAM